MWANGTAHGKPELVSSGRIVATQKEIQLYSETYIFPRIGEHFSNSRLLPNIMPGPNEISVSQ
jgi:hypothetical protein